MIISACALKEICPGKLWLRTMIAETREFALISPAADRSAVPRTNNSFCGSRPRSSANQFEVDCKKPGVLPGSSEVQGLVSLTGMVPPLGRGDRIRCLSCLASTLPGTCAGKRDCRRDAAQPHAPQLACLRA